MPPTTRRLIPTVAAALALAVATVVATPAAAQYFGQNKVQYRTYDWKSIRSDRFEVYFYTGLDSLAMRVLDLAEKTDALLSAKMGHRLTKPVPIVLYGTHNDFSQTNITPELIEGSTGGFTEVFRNRVVIPFTGSYEDLRHVLVHELVHAYMFDLMYGGNAAQMIAAQTFYSVPLWFAEGMAEYFSLGLESNAEVYLRDGIITGYLPPLMYSGGYIVYKQGQSAIGFLVDRYGEERLREVLRKLRYSRNFERAFQRGTGISVARFDEQWREWLKQRYWPTLQSKRHPEEFARRLTDHRRDESNANVSPAISPQGDRIAYLSDRRQYTDVYVMSAYDGKVIRRLIRGERNVQFEGIPSLRNQLAWSPDGKFLAVAAKSRGREILYVLDAANGAIRERHDLGQDALAYPAWGASLDSLAVVGVKDGRSDLWLVVRSAKRYRRLTDDTWDEKEPVWTPDGRGLTFSSDRNAPVVLHPLRHERAYGRYGIWQIDVASGATSPVLDTWGDDTAPAWSPDGRKLAFISDRGGTPNVFLWDRARGDYLQLTEVLGNVSNLSWARGEDRLVFSAFDRGGNDVFAVNEAIGSDAVLARLRRQRPEAQLDPVAMGEPGVPPVMAPPNRGALAGGFADSLSLAQDTLRAADPPMARRFDADSLGGVRNRFQEPPPWGGRTAAPFPVRADTLRPLASNLRLTDSGGPFDLPDSLLAQAPSPYEVRLQPDYAGGGFIAASGYGFAGSTQILFGDFLGNHSLYFATDLFGGSLEETNALAIYSYLPRRWDLSGGLFHFKNYYSSKTSTLGEAFGGPRTFSERSFGAMFGASYPFHRFRRVEFGWTQMFLERDFFEEDVFGDFYKTGTEYRSVSSPSISLIGDNALWGYYGPVNGTRYNLTFAPSFAWAANGLSYRSLTGDARQYWNLTRGYSFGTRLLGAVSDGRDAQTFRVGGFSTLRGYPDFDLLGTRVAIINTELRFPFIQQLGIVGPLPIGMFNIRGAAFADVGTVWDEGESPRLTTQRDGRRVLNDLAFGFGTGIRTWFLLGPMKLDVAWNTDFDRVSKPRWHFSIGPEF